MQKQFFVIVVTFTIISIIFTGACAGQAESAITGKPPAAGGSVTILVENTSISLPVREFKSGKDSIMEAIHSWLNSVLEGKVR